MSRKRSSFLGSAATSSGTAVTTAVKVTRFMTRPPDLHGRRTHTTPGRPAHPCRPGGSGRPTGSTCPVRRSRLVLFQTLGARQAGALHDPDQVVHVGPATVVRCDDPLPHLVDRRAVERDGRGVVPVRHSVAHPIDDPPFQFAVLVVVPTLGLCRVVHELDFGDHEEAAFPLPVHRDPVDFRHWFSPLLILTTAQWPGRSSYVLNCTISPSATSGTGGGAGSGVSRIFFSLATIHPTPTTTGTSHRTG